MVPAVTGIWFVSAKCKEFFLVVHLEEGCLKFSVFNEKEDKRCWLELNYL